MKSHFSNPLTEQAKFVEGRGIAELDYLKVVTVAGPDRLSWLNSLLSQQLDKLQAGDSTEALLLNPQGRLELMVRVLASSDEVYLIIDGNSQEFFIDYLTKMKFRKDVTIASTELKVYATHGVDTEAELIWHDNWPAISTGGYRYSDWTVPYPLTLSLVLSDLVTDLELVGSMAFDAVRVYAGKPSENEIDDKSLPHELDLLTSAVHLSKGCYRGQESVAKVHKLGHPPRRLTLLFLEDSEREPALGDPVLLGDKEVGKITSIGNHFEAGPIALALIKRNVAEDAQLTVGGSANQSATQQVLVPASAGSVSDIPKLPRLRLGK